MALMVAEANISTETRMPVSPKTQVFTSLQVGRGIAALAVVLFHCEDIGSLPKYWGWNHHFFYFGAGAVDFFFVLSGIVILHAHRRDIGVRKNVGSYLWKRARRVYPIYWIFLTVLLAAYFFKPALGGGSARQPSIILQSYLVIVFSKAFSIIQVAWTLFHEVLFYLVFSTLIINKKLGCVLMSAWMLASVFALAFPPQNPILAFYISPLHLLFGLGLVVSEAARRFPWKGTAIAYGGLTALIACCIYVNVTRTDVTEFPVVFGLCSGCTALGFMLMEKHRRLPVSKILVLLGDASYSIYLVHFTVLLVGMRVAFRLWRIHPVPVLIPFVLLLMIALGIGLCVYLFVEKQITMRLAKIPRKAK